MQLTYEQQLDLVAKGLATCSVNNKFTTFKYAKKIMYDYLWNDHPELKVCRGHTYDNTNGNVVTMPPNKTFNYLENDTWKDVPLNRKVYAYKKYNGFMAACSRYQGEIVVSTTGTTKSLYSQLAREQIFKENRGMGEGYTKLYEICHSSDPHIVDEGVDKTYSLGMTFHDDQEFNPSGVYIYSTLGDILEHVKTDKGEGFMLYDYNSPYNEHCCKLKTPYYIGKKILMRMNQRKVRMMYDGVDCQLPSNWAHAPLLIQKKFNLETWIGMKDQERRVFLEEIEL